MSVGSGRAVRAPGEANRRRLLDAGLEAFGRRGFHGTTTRDIAAAAGLSPAALYVHHRSKEELLYLICREGHEELLARLRAADAGGGDPARRLAMFVRTWVFVHIEGHLMARVINDELDALDDAHREEILRARRALKQMLAGIVTAGVAAGAFDVVDGPLTVRAILSMGIDIARWYRDEGRWTPEEIAGRYAALALRMVGSSDPDEVAAQVGTGTGAGADRRTGDPRAGERRAS